MSDCAHDSLSGDEGPIADLGRMPKRWRCDSCGELFFVRGAAHERRQEVEVPHAEHHAGAFVRAIDALRAKLAQSLIREMDATQIAKTATYQRDAALADLSALREDGHK